MLKVLCLIPPDTYDQDDPSDWTHTNDNDRGETVRFRKTVCIALTVVVT
ncbi:MAG: hypothetical protein ABIU85_09560 [Methylotenera sp.]